MNQSTSQFWISTLRKDVAWFCMLASGSLVLGLVLNQFRDNPLPLVYQDKAERLQVAVASLKSESRSAPTTKAIQLPATLTLAEFKNFVKAKQGLILDARPEIFHRLGHVPGALSLPRENFESGYRAIIKQLESDKTQPLALYCSSSSCEDAGLLKQALVGLGYSNIAVFIGGWDEWEGEPSEG